MKIVILENIRSAYNVGNVIRTADALGWTVWLVGYTPSPFDTPKVQKTSLGAEKNVPILRFDTTKEMFEYAKKKKVFLICAEITENATPLNHFTKSFRSEKLWIIFGNEITWVEKDTLKFVEKIVYIPMQWIKQSLNIWQTTAIFMWALN